MLKLATVFSLALMSSCLVGCDQLSEQKVKMDDFTVGSKPFSNKNIDKVCIFPEGASIPNNIISTSTAPYGKLTIVEHRKDSIVVKFADSDVLNHGYSTKPGMPHCFEKPENVVIRQGAGILLMAMEETNG